MIALLRRSRRDVASAEDGGAGRGRGRLYINLEDLFACSGESGECDAFYV